LYLLWFLLRIALKRDPCNDLSRGHCYPPSLMQYPNSKNSLKDQLNERRLEGTLSSNKCL
jgi:hypothetical protein